MTGLKEKVIFAEGSKIEPSEVKLRSCVDF